MRQRCRVTPGRGNPRDSATENRPLRFTEVRVKRWGKSPPRTWQQGRHGKPHREQCQIGVSRGDRSFRGYHHAGSFQPERPGLAARSPSVTAGPEEWSSNRFTAGNRIRLTGSPRLSSRVNDLLTFVNGVFLISSPLEPIRWGHPVPRPLRGYFETEEWFEGLVGIGLTGAG